MFSAASSKQLHPAPLAYLGPRWGSKRVRRIKQAARALGLACIRRAKHKLDIAFPVESTVSSRSSLASGSSLCSPSGVRKWSWPALSQ
jgi:hypothetical protein